ncbi:MAG: capsule assembly Wzi family protein [Firmicutes bacterium]|nr:capsule assembly Wzi family protein [Bacillota bacterium]MCM1401522.1 capsule assembly Wzi family protein [Bacteroides sp.]MCM1477372.1 capsule assembly Wzi family protein [Bacteroides sp.]
MKHLLPSALMLLSAIPAMAVPTADSVAVVTTTETVTTVTTTSATDTVTSVSRSTSISEKLIEATTPHPLSFNYKVEGMAATSSGHTPFWLLNNRLGLSSLKQNNGYIRGAAIREMATDKRFSWGAGIDLVVPYNFTSNFVIQQLYGEIRYRCLEFTLGSKERYMGLVNRELSSGDLTFSLNARPVPQAFLAMPRYEWVPWTRHWLAAKAYVSFGMFTDWRWQRDLVGPDGRWTEKLLYHSKGLFLRLGDPARHPFLLEGGLEMGAQFGGTAYFVDDYGQHHVVHLPHGAKDIIKIIFPMGGGDSSDPDQLGEVANVLGNHLGQWSAALTFAPRNSEWQFRTYYLHYFDDHSQMFLQHAWKDMLLGVEVTFPKNPVISQFVYEYLYSKDQSGAVYWDHNENIPEQVSGRDDYYNHYIYPGWSHWGMGMGNPLIISPIYNKDNTLMFYHNRIKGHHFGWKGQPFVQLSYRVLISYTRSWGTYNYPTANVMHNFNSMLEATYSPRRLKGWDFRLGLAADGGRLLGKSFGAMLTISKSGCLLK